jgi:hypothetical protein
MSATAGPGGQPSEEELQAAYEAQLKQLRVEHILLDNVVALINLAMRRTGLAPGTEGERDPGQVQLAIEAVRALMPQLEQVAPEEISQIRGALSQLQMAYVRIGGQTPAGEGSPGAEAPAAGAPGAPPSAAPSLGETPDASPQDPSGAGPAQRSGRLWVPGQ